MTALSITRMRITRAEFDDFRHLVVRRRWDWPAVFSVNPRGQIWPFVTNGYTPEAERVFVGGVAPIIDVVADELLALRPLGGRFFINEVGAYLRPDDEYVKFVQFHFRQ